MVPYHMIGAVEVESAILGGYARHVRSLHPDAPVPGFYMGEQLFADANSFRATMGDEVFFSRLYRTSRWDSIRTAFSARGIDPRLRGYDWLVDLLLERPPSNGYPPAPSGILDLDTAWREVLSQFLGLQEGRVDAADLLTWTLDAAKLERFAALTSLARERIAEQLSAKGGPAVGLIVSAVMAGRGADAMALGLVCTVAFATDQVDGVLADAAIRLEPFFAGQTVSVEAGAAFADAARRVAERLAREPGRVGRNHHDRAVALLSEIRVTGQAVRSRVLLAGFEARLPDGMEASEPQRWRGHLECPPLAFRTS